MSTPNFGVLTLCNMCVICNSSRFHYFIFELCIVIVHTLKMCTGEAGPEQSLVMLKVFSSLCKPMFSKSLFSKNSFRYTIRVSISLNPGLEVIKLEYSLRLKIKRNEWLLADTCPQVATHCALF